MLDNLPDHIPVEVKDMSDADLKTQITNHCAFVLPRRAKKKKWKVKSDDVFRRIIYDNVFGKPWDQAVNPPAIRNMTRHQMALVYTLCRLVFEGKVDTLLLLERSNGMRG